MNQLLAKYMVPFLLIKVFEFVSCAALATCLILAAPGTIYAEGGVVEAVRGGLIFAGMFFTFTLYPVASLVAFFLTLAVASSGRLIAMASGAFLLAYAALFALSASHPFLLGFWLAWLCMGAATSAITFLVIRWKRGVGSARRLEARR